MPGRYDFAEYPPFYAIGDRFRVAAVDIPQARIVDNVNGVQILSYGAHAPFSAPESRPSDLLPRLVRKHGKHPAGNGNDYARFWSRGSLSKLVRQLSVGAARRSAICCELLESQSWDLFIAVFSEIHSVCHYLWHTSQPDHPLYEHFRHVFAGDQMLLVAAAVDKALGAIVASAPANAQIVVFSQEGMVANAGDIPSSLLLPELLYRYSFKGRRGIEPRPGSLSGHNRPCPPPVLRPSSRAWHREAWALKHDNNLLRRYLRSNLPIELGWLVEKTMGAPPGPRHPWNFEVKYQPAVWYSPYWPDMKAFALPSASQQGKIRINLRGREARGVVEAEDYAATCIDIMQHLATVRNARSGLPIVQSIDGPATGALIAHAFADLIVHWNPEPADTFDSPTFGRFGPVQFMRTGGHIERGFVVAVGPGIRPGSSLETGKVVDLAPTILSMVGAPMPADAEGRCLVPARSSVGLT
jgi:hypothetical protein